ncbi:hypothetical protein [Halegenticoccus soli]|uniref:hypothetical protein n=1 Tax=Halegenticoccus soli TaxID=1985678 RepID=UPI000C6ECD7A|nr:hypothetical protein [Halegenticoccus soli]
MVDRIDALRGLALASFGGLCLVLVAVATVAFVAEMHRTWEWYFRMERAISFATPLALGLCAAAMVGGFGLVFLAPEE